MNIKITFTVIALLLGAANARKVDQGPQTFEASTQAPSSPSPQPQYIAPSPSPQPEYPAPSPAPELQYATREVIVYLTPSQIRALESGRGVLEPVAVPQSQPESESQPNIDLIQLQRSAYERQNDELRNQLALQKTLELQHQQNAEEAARAIQEQTANVPRPPPVEEPSEEQNPQELPSRYGYAPEGYGQPQENQKLFEPERPENSLPKSYTYFNLYSRKKPDDNINIKIFHPLPHDAKLSDELEGKNLETQIDPLLKKKFKLIPYEYLSRKSQELGQLQEQPQEQERDYFGQKQSERQLNTLLTPLVNHERIADASNYQRENANDQEERREDEYLKLKYAPKYSDQQQEIELKNLIKKQQALAKAEAIAKSPAVEVHREVSITKHKPVHIIKHIQVPVPQPYLVRVPEPFEVKVPQPYPVPLEIIRHVPVPIVRTEKIEVEKPVPYEVEKRIPVPVTKKVYVKVDKPYYVQRVVPVEVKKEVPVEIPVRKPQKLSIIRHVWEH